MNTTEIQLDNSSGQLKCKIFVIDDSITNTKTINEWFSENPCNIVSFHIIPGKGNSRIMYHYYDAK